MALLLASSLFEDVRLQGDFASALWVAALFSVLSFFFGWFLFALLGVATLGIGFVFHFVTKLVVAALVLKMTSALSARLTIEGFLPAIGTALMLALASQVGSLLLH